MKACIFFGGYCMTDNGHDQLGFVHHNVHVEDMKDGKLEHAQFWKVRLKNMVSLSRNNIMQREHYWTKFHMKKKLEFLFFVILFLFCLLFSSLLVLCVRAGNFIQIIHGNGREERSFHLEDHDGS